MDRHYKRVVQLCCRNILNIVRIVVLGVQRCLGIDVSSLGVVSTTGLVESGSNNFHVGGVEDICISSHVVLVHAHSQHGCAFQCKSGGVDVQSQSGNNGRACRGFVIAADGAGAVDHGAFYDVGSRAARASNTVVAFFADIAVPSPVMAESGNNFLRNDDFAADGAVRTFR